MSISTPRVTIILPTYNSELYLSKAIDSVLKQTFTAWRLLIIDDGSTDGTRKMFEGGLYRDDRISYRRNDKNLGLIASLNLAIGLVEGEYFARLDADDFWLDEQKLAYQVDFLDNHPDCAMVGTGAVAVEETGRRVGLIQVSGLDDKIRKRFLVANQFVHSSIVARTGMVKRAGGYDSAMKHVEDYELWLRLGINYRLANLPAPMVAYRVNMSGITSSNNLEQIRRCCEVAKKYRREYPGFFLAYFKWNLQYIFVRLLGFGKFSKLKNLLKRITFYDK